MSEPRPSAYHQAQLALMKAQIQNEQFSRLCAQHEVQMIEVRELRSDPDSERQAQELIERMRKP